MMSFRPARAIAIGLSCALAVSAQSVFTVGARGTHANLQAAVDACPSAGCTIQIVDTLLRLPREVWIGHKSGLSIVGAPALRSAGIRPRLVREGIVLDDAGTAVDPDDPSRPVGWKRWPLRADSSLGGSRNTSNPRSRDGYQYNGMIVVDSSTNVRIEGLVLDGEEVQFFFHDSVSSWALRHLFGSVGINLHHSLNAVVRDCELRNFFAAVYLNGRNPGGWFPPRGETLSGGEAIRPGSTPGRMGAHLVEGNFIHDNWWAIYDDQEWDLGSTFRFNRCLGNRTPGYTEKRRSLGLDRYGDDVFALVGGFLYEGDSTRVVHRIHHNTIHGSPLLVCFGRRPSYRFPEVIGTSQHVFHDNLVTGFSEVADPEQRGMIGSAEELRTTMRWIRNNVFEIATDSGLIREWYRAARTSDSTLCRIVEQTPPNCWLSLDTNVRVITGLKSSAFGIAWKPMGGAKYTGSFRGVNVTDSSTSIIEHFPGGGWFDTMYSCGVKRSSIADSNAWVIRFPYASLDPRNPRFLVPDSTTPSVRSAAIGRWGVRGFVSGADIRADIGAVQRDPARTYVGGLVDGVAISAGSGCWTLPLRTEGGADLGIADLDSIRVWFETPGFVANYDGFRRFIPAPTSSVVRSGSSLTVCTDSSPSVEQRVRIQVDATFHPPSGGVVRSEPATFLAGLPTESLRGVGSRNALGRLHIARRTGVLLVSGLAAAPVRLELVGLDGRLLHAADLQPSSGRVSLDRRGLPAGLHVLRVRQDDGVRSQPVVLP